MKHTKIITHLAYDATPAFLLYYGCCLPSCDRQFTEVNNTVIQIGKSRTQD